MKSRKRNRKLGFDYSSEAKYFLTICCKDRIHHFGEIKNSKIILNEYGKITDRQIQWLEKQYPYFLLHNYIVMPNHVHILCEINIANIETALKNKIEMDDKSNNKINNISHVRTARELSLLSNPINQSPIKIKSISQLMGALKTTSSKKIHLAGNKSFKWQRSFYDNIVRNNISYQRIFNYITNNPAKWEDDKFNKN